MVFVFQRVPSLCSTNLVIERQTYGCFNNYLLLIRYRNRIASDNQLLLILCIFCKIIFFFSQIFAFFVWYLDCVPIMTLKCHLALVRFIFFQKIIVINNQPKIVKYNKHKSFQIDTENVISDNILTLVEMIESESQLKLYSLYLYKLDTRDVKSFVVFSYKNN